MSPNDGDTLAWWKYGHVWLVIAGPAAVVVASMVTIWLAVRWPDPVLTEPQDRRSAIVVVDEKGKPADAAGAMLPAVQARNHAATPSQPAR